MLFFYRMSPKGAPLLIILAGYPRVMVASTLQYKLRKKYMFNFIFSIIISLLITKNLCLSNFKQYRTNEYKNCKVLARCCSNIKVVISNIMEAWNQSMSRVGTIRCDLVTFIEYKNLHILIIKCDILFQILDSFAFTYWSLYFHSFIVENK